MAKWLSVGRHRYRSCPVPYGRSIGWPSQPSLQRGDGIQGQGGALCPSPYVLLLPRSYKDRVPENRCSHSRHLPLSSFLGQGFTAECCSGTSGQREVPEQVESLPGTPSRTCMGGGLTKLGCSWATLLLFPSAGGALSTRLCIN